MTAADARRLAARLPCFKGKKPSAARLKGGITNSNFKIDCAGESFVLRVGGKGAALLGIDRRREHAATAAAAALGIGAELVHSDADADILVTRFIAGRPIAARLASASPTLGEAARLIKAVHEGPAFPGVFTAFGTVRRYCALALERGVRLPPEADQALSEMSRMEKTLGPLAALRPCHNDLLPGNFIRDGKALRLIDWEYAAMGDPWFDLGNFAVNHRLDRAARRRLLKDYGLAAGASDIQRLELMRRASDLREAFWGFLQAGVSRLRFDFMAYGRRHLRRFTREAR